ncbi:MAG: NADH-quinone oxidoreductase subunit J [Leptospiraceae bacterium]|nr:NADH-quinone oxidoreductase subunit J [Leptospiraceae bacterium]MCP5497712.1 NADH-quinone oxidoreductase subunit J [Leptospiraceae bacterium]
MLNFSDPQSIIFVIFSIACVVSALTVILHRNPVTSAVFLVLCFFSLAGIYALMNAIFIATMQVLVYAGAIMVLVVFVLMLLSLKEEIKGTIWKRPFKKTIIVSILLFFTGLLVFSLIHGGSLSNSGSVATSNYQYNLNNMFNIQQEGDVVVSGNTATVGAATFIDYLLPFEMVSVLLLAAVIGAVILAKKKL